MNAVDFVDHGGFHPKLLPHYGSDYEYTIRASKNGYRIFSHPDVKVWTSGIMSGVEELEHELESRNFWRSLKILLFSKRCRRNVVYLSIFAALTCRWYCTPGIVIKLWVQEIRNLFRVLPTPVYGLIRLFLLPFYYLVKELVVYLRLVVAETINSKKIILGRNTNL